jgi:endogenous inhibitor of DNA gyrase (YacG/DUF329 family)
MEDITEYSTCRTCGRYMEKSEAYHNQFCSRECSLRHLKCKTCGRYFIAGESPYDEFCSEECHEYFSTPLVEVDIPDTEGERNELDFSRTTRSR